MHSRSLFPRDGQKLWNNSQREDAGEYGPDEHAHPSAVVCAISNPACHVEAADEKTVANEACRSIAEHEQQILRSGERLRESQQGGEREADARTCDDRHEETAEVVKKEQENVHVLRDNGKGLTRTRSAEAGRETGHLEGKCENHPKKLNAREKSRINLLEEDYCFSKPLPDPRLHILR